MTVMADFLLQPSVARSGSVKQDAGTATVARIPDSGRDFSRLLEQQQQAERSEGRPVEHRSQNEARPQTARPATPAVERQCADAPRKQDQQQESLDSVRQDGQISDAPGTEPIAKPGDAMEEKASSYSEADDEKVPEQEGAVPGSLNTLLEQILQAHGTLERGGEAGADAEETPVPVSPVAVTHMAGAGMQNVEVSQQDTSAVFAHVAGFEGQQDGVVVRASQQLQTASAQMATDALEISEDLTDLELNEALPELEEPLLQAQLQTPGLKQQQATAEVQPVRAERLAGVGNEVRTDALMRSEAVQPTQAARQLAGQPLDMQQPGWSKELTDRVMWLSSQNLKSAEIKLNPAELGRLDIRVQMGQEHTQITFTSAHAGVRESLDGQIHRLREMLEQQGMSQVDVEVSGRSHSQEQEQQTGRSGLANDAGSVEEEQLQAVTEVEEPVRGHSGTLSYYV